MNDPHIGLTAPFILPYWAGGPDVSDEDNLGVLRLALCNLPEGIMERHATSARARHPILRGGSDLQVRHKART